MKPIFLCMAFAIIYSFSFSQNLSLQWAISNEGNIAADHRGTVMDSDGNLISLIWYAGTVDFDPGSNQHLLTAVGGSKYIIQKLDESGTFDWVVELPGQGHSVMIDEHDQIVVCGRLLSAGAYDMDPTAGVDSVVSNYSSYGYIIYLSPTGQYLSHTLFEASSNYHHFLVWNVIDAGNSEKYVVGWSFGTSDLDPGSGFYSNPTGKHEVILKLDANDDLVWVASYPDSSQYISGTLLNVFEDENGELNLVYNSDGSFDADPGPNIDMKYDDGVNIIKLDGNGQYSGYVPLRLEIIDVFFYSNVRVKKDTDGNFILCGSLDESLTVDFDPGPNQELLTAQSGIGLGYIAKYDPTGNLLWVNSFENDPIQHELEWYEDLFYHFVIDENDNIYTIGSIQGSVNMDPNGSNIVSSSDSSDVLICQYNPNGDLNFAFTLDGLDDDWAYQSLLGLNGELIVTGMFEGDCDFDPDAANMILQSGGKDTYMIKFKPNNLSLKGETGYDELTVYPNPLSSILNISGLRGAANLKIFNTQGQLLKEIQNFSDGSIDFSTFDTGIYILSIELGGQIITKRIIRS